MRPGTYVALVATAVLALAPPADAQTLGTFSWQLAPFCNVVTVSATQNGGLYTLDGYDDQCGGPVRASVVGVAVPNPNGSITLGFTIVTPPGGAPVHVQAAIDLGSFGGAWSDNQGNGGGFVFTPSGTASGNPRPPAGVAAGLTAGAVTSTHIADGAVGSADIDAAQVQRRIAAACPQDQLMTGVNQDGSVACQALSSGAGGDITAVNPGIGLTGGGATGDVSLAANFTEVQARIANSCPANQFMRSVGANGSPGCEPVGTAQTAVNATQLGGVTAGQYVVTGDPRLTDARMPLPNSNHYLRNGGTPQAGDFNISGSGIVGGTLTAGTVSSSSQFNLGSTRVLGKFGTNNLVLGFLAGGANGGKENTLVGDSAGVENTGDENTFLGFTAGQRNTSGSNNVYVGARAGLRNDTGSFNAYLGDGAGQLGGGDGNTALGASTLDHLLSGDANVALGRGAGASLLNGDDNLYLDNSGTNVESNTIRVGTALRHSRFFANAIRGVTTGSNNAVAVVIDSAGQLGTVSSSRRTKFDIADLDASVSPALQRLRPVEFRYRQAFADGSTPLQYGLIAEEVQDVLPELVALDEAGQPASVKYHVLPALLLAEVQRLERERVTGQALAAAQALEIARLRGDLQAIRTLLDEVAGRR